MAKTRNRKKMVSPDVPVSAGKTKKEAKSKTPSSNRKKGDGGGRNDKRKKNPAATAARSREATNMANKNNDDDVSVNSTISQPITDATLPEIPIVSRQNFFSESLWWMVDLEYDPVAESKSRGGTYCPASPTSASSANRQGATPLVKRCMRMYGWDLPTTRKILKGYRQFLHLKKHFEDWDATILSPSEQIDKMWHAHILDVNNYVHDCILLCGHVVGHNPDGMVDGEAKAARVKFTKEALIERFGPGNFDETVWMTRRELEEKEQEYQDLTSDKNPDPPVTIVVHDETGMQTFFKIKTTTKMSKLFEAYCKLRDIDVDNPPVRFLFNGDSLSPDHTPNSWEMEDGDRIDVFPEQSGC